MTPSNYSGPINMHRILWLCLLQGICHDGGIFPNSRLCISAEHLQFSQHQHHLCWCLGEITIWFFDAFYGHVVLWFSCVLQSKDEEFLEELIEQEKRDIEYNRKHAHDEELKQQQTKKKNKEALIDELVSLLWSNLSIKTNFTSQSVTSSILSLKPMKQSVLLLL